MTMTDTPVNLTAVLASFEEIYNPRTVARMNDYAFRVAHTKGEHVWHSHDNTDEFYLVIDGQFDIALRDPASQIALLPSTQATPSWSPRASSTSRPRPAVPSSR